MAKKDVNVISSFVGKGLEREAILIQDLLKEHDVYTNFYHYTNIANSQYVRADCSIFLEVVMPNALSLSRENWLLPNSEWWNPANDRFLPQFTKILCKTRDCERIWKEKLKNDQPERVIYTGFECRDLHDGLIERENRFLHVAGESEHKNTEAVIEAWRRANWTTKVMPLTVVTRQKKYQDLCVGVESITCVKDKIGDDELKRLMNSHRFHLMPCQYEGFGHALHEGAMCGALMLTTAAPPMSEFAGIQSDWSVRSTNSSVRSLATMHFVTPQDVQVAVEKPLLFVARLSEEQARKEQALKQSAIYQPMVSIERIEGEFSRRSQEARQAALADREGFRQKFLELLNV